MSNAVYTVTGRVNKLTYCNNATGMVTKQLTGFVFDNIFGTFVIANVVSATG